MKTKITLFALFLFTFLGCQKSDDVDPRDQYVGSYDLKTNVVYPVVQPGTTSQIMILSKSDKPNGLTMSFNSGQIPATLGTDGTFSIDPYTYSYTANGFPYKADYEGNGAISGKDLVLSLTVVAREVGKTTTYKFTVNGIKRN